MRQYWAGTLLAEAYMYDNASRGGMVRRGIGAGRGLAKGFKYFQEFPKIFTGIYRGNFFQNPGANVKIFPN
jgi:hypothetical protein